MSVAHAASPRVEGSLIERLNGSQHEFALRVFMVIVLAHWARAPTSGISDLRLGWPVPEARGLVGYFFPWVIQSEALHYGYALVMLVGLWLLRPDSPADRSPVVDDRAGDPVLPPLRASAAAAPGHSGYNFGGQPVRPASRSSGSRASSCTCSTTPSSSSRW